MFDLSSEDYTGENQFSQLEAGVKIPAKLVAVAVDDESGDLIFSFKGTDEGDASKGLAPNNGTFNHRVWANNFDKTHEFYDKVWAKRYINQIKHILKAYMPIAEVEAIKGGEWLDFAADILNKFTEDKFKDVPVFIKVVLDNKNRTIFPAFPDFISSQLMPKTLKLDTRTNPNTGRAYERIEPIELEDATPAPLGGEAAANSGDTQFGDANAAASGAAGTDEATPAFV